MNNNDVYVYVDNNNNNYINEDNCNNDLENDDFIVEENNNDEIEFIAKKKTEVYDIKHGYNNYKDKFSKGNFGNLIKNQIATTSK